MKITKVETFLVRWGDVSRAGRGRLGSATAVVAIHADGMVGLGEASPMQGGIASLGSSRATWRPRWSAPTCSTMPSPSIACCTS